MSLVRGRQSLRSRLLLGCLLLATPFLVGSKCIFVVSSGGDDDVLPPVDPNEPELVVKQGRIAPWPTQGLT